MDMIEIRQLDSRQLSAVYQDHMIHDFHAAELKPLRMMLDAIGRGEYICLGCFMQETLCGYAMLVQVGADLLLDYFAVIGKYRDSGIGSRFLGMLRGQFADADSLLIESENPDYMDNDAERQTAERRLRFYARCGCRDTGVTAQVFGVEYRILELPVGKLHSQDEIRAVYAKLYHSFLSAPRYNRHMLLR